MFFKPLPTVGCQPHDTCPPDYFLLLNINHSTVNVLNQSAFVGQLTYSALHLGQPPHCLHPWESANVTMYTVLCTCLLLQKATALCLHSLLVTHIPLSQSHHTLKQLISIPQSCTSLSHTHALKQVIHILQSYHTLKQLIHTLITPHS